MVFNPVTGFAISMLGVMGILSSMREHISSRSHRIVSSVTGHALAWNTVKRIITVALVHNSDGKADHSPSGRGGR
jgi:hypothetical protein